MKKISIHIEELKCNSCSASIEKLLNKIKISEFSINLTRKIVSICFDPETMTEEYILKKLKRSGYKGEILQKK